MNMKAMNSSDIVPIATFHLIDFSESYGQIRPLHGVNGGPLSCGSWLDHTPAFEQMEVPGIRFHDAMWPGVVVDMHHIFPDFSRDPQDPTAYVFHDTDRYVLAAAQTGARLMYRLGHSAGSFYGAGWPRPGTRPSQLRQEDYPQWAAIALGIVRHYNDGWADGHHLNIAQWEVWNEANASGWWKGTAEEFADLYGQTANAIKSCFPALEVGAFGWVTSDPAFSQDEVDPHREFVERFLSSVSKRKLPLDFVTWHSYLGFPETVLKRSRDVRTILSRHGLNHVKDILGEWSICPVQGLKWDYLFRPDGDPVRRGASFAFRHGAEGAAGTACVLSLLQDTETSEAHYYTADSNPFGMFDLYGAPYANHYALKAFAQMCHHQHRVPVVHERTLCYSRSEYDSPCESDRCPPGMTVLAGINEARTSAAILLSNYDAPAREHYLSVKGLEGAWTVSVSRLSDTRRLCPDSEPVLLEDHDLRFDAAPATVLYIELTAVASGSPSIAKATNESMMNPAQQP